MKLRGQDEVSFKAFEAKIDESQPDLLSRYRKTGLSQSRNILIMGIFVVVIAVVLGATSFALDPARRPIRSYTAGLLAFVLAGVSWWCIARSLELRRGLSEFLADLSDSAQYAKAARELRARAQRLRRSAQFSLFLIVAALAAGLGLFVFSASIANFDRYSVLRMEFEYRRELDRERALLQKDLNGDLSDSSKNQVKRLEDRIQGLENQILANSTSGTEKVVEDQRFTQQLITTTTTRIGSIVILLFLVQILVTLYRYNVRASAFYDARADALRLATEDDSKLGRLVDVFTPTAVDFGKVPATPLQSALDVAKAALKHTRAA